jgi:hypothetical protein
MPSFENNDEWKDMMAEGNDHLFVSNSCYSITSSTVARSALQKISQQISSTLSDHSSSKLQLISINETFDVELLTRFYNQLMIPNFPLEDERDDLDDWLFCLDPQQKTTEGPTMDVLILTEEIRDEDQCKILAGVAFEYYQNAQVGLLSYMVVTDEFRRLGILRSLHPVACHAMEQLHQDSIMKNHMRQSNMYKSPIKAILAETNTLQAGDAAPEIILKRHEILHRLGYRHLKFPYVQPPLAEDGESFDDIMLLMYCGDDGSNSTMDTDILYHYVVDFYQSVFGYNENHINKYRKHWYFQLVEWFQIHHPTTEITHTLPWEDVTPRMQLNMEAARQEAQKMSTEHEATRLGSDRSSRKTKKRQRLSTTQSVISLLLVHLSLFLLLDLSLRCQATFPKIGWHLHPATTKPSSAMKCPSFPADLAVSGGGHVKDEHLGQKKGKDSPLEQQRLSQSLMTFYNNLRTGNVVRPCTIFMQHVLYWLTAADAVHSLFLNEYSGIYKWLYASTTITEKTALVPSMYSKLFYFARLRPRLLYAIGALVRALQLCTPFRKVLDPSIGVGAGVNLCALLAGSRWVKPFVLGWTTTKWLWTWLGARQVDRAFLPITLSIHEWEDKKSQKKKGSNLVGNSNEG